MAKIQVSTPKGVREFSPSETFQRNELLTFFRTLFERYGFLPLETGAMENLSVLEGKYGEEGDRLLFRILNSGDYLDGVEGDPREMPRKELTQRICEKGLRYDLTVPFARYVATHWQELPHPFKRYQIQPVWRADRPQKGRYREFLQCDVDIVGSQSLINEIELLGLVAQGFYVLGIPVDIHVNSRLILEDIAERMGHPELLVPMTVALDKLDKIGEEAVAEELVTLGFAAGEVDHLLTLCSEKSLVGVFMQLFDWLPKTPQVRRHLDDLITIFVSLQPVLMVRCDPEWKGENLPRAFEQRMVIDDSHFWPEHVAVHFTPSLARGLSYYTGTIFEVKARDTAMGSICGGGRYDNLTEIFGLKGVSGVGLSFGIERIYDIMLERKVWDAAPSMIDCLCGCEEEVSFSLVLYVANVARQTGLRTLVLPDAMKLKKQMEYANKHNIRWVVVAINLDASNPEPISLKIRDMDSGEEYTGNCVEVFEKISQITNNELENR